MNEYEKELIYVRLILKSVKTLDNLAYAKELKKQFIAKYIVLISPTDKTFLKVQNELIDLEVKATRRISSNYLF
jgi:hypothetical protein